MSNLSGLCLKGRGEICTEKRKRGEVPAAEASSPSGGKTGNTGPRSQLSDQPGGRGPGKELEAVGAPSPSSSGNRLNVDMRTFVRFTQTSAPGSQRAAWGAVGVWSLTCSPRSRSGCAARASRAGGRRACSPQRNGSSEWAPRPPTGWLQAQRESRPAGGSLARPPPGPVPPSGYRSA